MMIYSLEVLMLKHAIYRFRNEGRLVLFGYEARRSPQSVTVVLNANMKSAGVCLHRRESKRVINIVHEKMNGLY